MHYKGYVWVDGHVTQEFTFQAQQPATVPNNIQLVNFDGTSEFTNTYSYYTVTFNLNNDIPYGGMIMLKFSDNVQDPLYMDECEIEAGLKHALCSLVPAAIQPKFTFYITNFDAVVAAAANI